jgi:hypothetical protein
MNRGEWNPTPGVVIGIAPGSAISQHYRGEPDSRSAKMRSLLR